MQRMAGTSMLQLALIPRTMGTFDDFCRGQRKCTKMAELQIMSFETNVPSDFAT